jgi:hypothetical protein
VQLGMREVLFGVMFAGMLVFGVWIG